MSKKLVIVLFISSLIGCIQHDKLNSVDILKAPSDSIENLKVRVLRHGDTSAYNELSLYYTLRLAPWPLLYYSQLMCNKYNYPFSCYDCYMIDYEKYSGDNMKSNDTLTQKMGIYYLLKAHELGYQGAEDDIKKVFDNNQIPKSNEYLKRILDKN